MLSAAAGTYGKDRPLKTSIILTMRLLLVEDDEGIAGNLKLILERHGFAVDIAPDAQSARDKAIDEQYDLFVLDWMLPDGSGVQLAQGFRSDGIHAPILMLTAKSDAADIVEGLDSGADDYLTKPFTTTELLARLRALLRRSAQPVSDSTILIDDLQIDTNTYEVTRSGKKISLSPKEYSLLLYLAQNTNRALERMELLSHVWDEETDVFSNTVDVHILYLRRKIDSASPHKLIKTVKGKGYRLCV